ncbi:MAG: hypothetical protein K0R03_385 [Moraxellaceae bacterium]|jgi:hypothetical protein|nr:hypothetical protein [Moraxellaceae bacterium]
MQLIIKEKQYFSQLDEDNFFSWLQGIEGVSGVTGTSQGLSVSLSAAQFSNESLHDLLALYARYDLDMRQLAQFETPENSSWFRNSKAFWHKRVFG